MNTNIRSRPLRNSLPMDEWTLGMLQAHSHELTLLLVESTLNQTPLADRVNIAHCIKVLEDRIAEVKAIRAYNVPLPLSCFLRKQA